MAGGTYCFFAFAHDESQTHLAFAEKTCGHFLNHGIHGTQQNQESDTTASFVPFVVFNSGLNGV